MLDCYILTITRSQADFLPVTRATHLLGLVVYAATSLTIPEPCTALHCTALLHAAPQCQDCSALHWNAVRHLTHSY